MSLGFPLIIEGLVAILLMFTILYCMRLNRSIKRLKGQENALKATIAELVTATETAERAIAGLKSTMREAEQNLGERLNAAEKFSSEIASQLEGGESVLNRLAQIASIRPIATGQKTGVRPAKSEAPDTKKIMAAAKAFADRARSRAQGRAA